MKRHIIGWQDTTLRKPGKMKIPNIERFKRLSIADSSEKYFLPKRSVGALLLNKLDLEIKQSYLRDALETSSLLGKYSLTDGDLKYIEGIVSQD